LKRNETISTLHQLSDEEILKAGVSASAKNAWGELYKRYAALTLGLCLKYLKDREAAKDASSEIFVRLKADMQKQQIENFRSWFYVYTKNHCLGILRKQQNTQRKQAVVEETLAFHSQTPYDFENDLQISAVTSALEQLKPDQRNCISEFYLARQTYEEVAEKLNYTIKQVKSHLQNGRRNLRLIMEENTRSNRQS